MVLVDGPQATHSVFSNPGGFERLRRCSARDETVSGTSRGGGALVLSERLDKARPRTALEDG